MLANRLRRDFFKAKTANSSPNEISISEHGNYSSTTLEKAQEKL